MGPTQSAKVALLTFLGRTVQGMDHMLEKPPPGLDVLVKVRITTVVGAHVGATG